MLETLESSRYARTIANYVYQKRPYTCLQQEFKMEKDPNYCNKIYEGFRFKGATIEKVIALFLIEVIALFLIKGRGVAISKKDVLVLAGVGATIGVLLYGVGRLLK